MKHLECADLSALCRFPADGSAPAPTCPDFYIGIPTSGSALCRFRSTLSPPSRSTSFQGLQMVGSSRLMPRTERYIRAYIAIYPPIQLSEDKKIKK
jgi:hypothetical protein